MLHFWINKHPKFGQFYRGAEIKWSVCLDKTHFFYYVLVLARPFQPETILFWWMQIGTTQLLFVQSMLNRSSDHSGLIKLAKFRLFIYSKLEPKIDKIYRNFCISEKPRVWELTRCVDFRNTANTSEIMSWFSDVYFFTFLANVSYFL